jgi:hypothetical protein
VQEAVHIPDRSSNDVRRAKIMEAADKLKETLKTLKVQFPEKAEKEFDSRVLTMMAKYPDGRKTKSRLTHQQREKIRSRYTFGTITYKELAAEFGVSIGTIARIVEKP